MNSSEILQIPWKEKLKYEENMLKKAIQIITPEDQLVIVKREISIFLRECQIACDIISDVDMIGDTELIEQLSRALKKPSMDNSRFILIMIFIRQQISPDLEAKIQTKLRKKIKYF